MAVSRAARLSPAEENCRKSPCPRCSALPGMPCTNGKAATRMVHFQRREAAIRDGHHTP